LCRLIDKAVDISTTISRPVGKQEGKLKRKLKNSKFWRRIIMIRIGEHDVGGLKDQTSLNEDRPIEFWERRVHSTLSILSQRALIKTDEMRRGIENLPPIVYNNSSYYGK